MKTICLVFDQIKSLIRKNLTLFLLVFSGLVVVFFILTYSYGNLSPSKRLEGNNGIEYKSFTVHFIHPVELEKEKLYAVDEFHVLDVLTEYVSDIEIKGLDSYLLVDAYRENNKSGELVFTELFADSQLNGRNIILPLFFRYSKESDEETLSINGRDYLITKKVHMLWDDISYVPINSFLNGDFTVDKIRFTLEKIPDKKTQAVIMEKLKQEFDECYILPPKQHLEFENQAVKQMLLIIFLACLLSVAGLLFMTRAMITENSYEYLVFTLVGCSNKKLFAVLYSTVSSFILSSCVIACLIHKIGYPLIDQYLNVYTGITFYFKDYLLIFLFAMIISCLVVSIFIAFFVFRSLVHMKRTLQ